MKIFSGNTLVGLIVTMNCLIYVGSLKASMMLSRSKTTAFAALFSSTSSRSSIRNKYEIDTFNPTMHRLQNFASNTAMFSKTSEIDSSFTSSIRRATFHTVEVLRNKQSLAFREGSPLIFSGSVAATYSESLEESEKEDIPMGALVAVVVGRKSPTLDSGREKTKNNPGNKRKSYSAAKASENNKSAYLHHNIFDGSDENNAQQMRDEINKSQLIGYGVYNPHSMYRVRMLCHETIHPKLTKELRLARKQIQRGEEGVNYEILYPILERKLIDAMRLRVAMNLPSDMTDTYRLVNGEGDGLSGLAVDILGGSTAIVMSSAAWCEIHKETIKSVLAKLLKQHQSYANVDIDIVWRNTPSRLRQDGYEVMMKDDSASDEDDRGEQLALVAMESSVKYLTYPYSDGQKTGFYCDQRENRLMIAQLCENKRILDLCCYNGGFALNAIIRGSAASATGVDSSQDAVDAAIENASLNGLDAKKISFVRDEIATFMKTAIEDEEEYDVIVLDPPKLAPSLSSLDKASRKYHALNRDAMNLINKEQGGLLLTCTCSAAMTQKDGGRYFLNMVNGAALSAKRRVTLLRVCGAAPCHTQSPASFPAGAYLTAALFHVGPADS